MLGDVVSAFGVEMQGNLLLVYK